MFQYKYNLKLLLSSDRMLSSSLSFVFRCLLSLIISHIAYTQHHLLKTEVKKQKWIIIYGQYYLFNYHHFEKLKMLFACVYKQQSKYLIHRRDIHLWLTALFTYGTYSSRNFSQSKLIMPFGTFCNVTFYLFSSMIC